MHTEGLQHLGRARKGDPAGLLAGCQCCQEKRDEAILAPGESVLRMTGDEQHELAVATFVDQGPGRRAFYRKAAEDKWTGGEAQVIGDKRTGKIVATAFCAGKSTTYRPSK